MQFVHTHFYAKSGGYVQKTLKRLSGKSSFAALLTYGKTAHYVSDFCCSVHFGGGIGNVREHIMYERALNCYALKNQDLLRAECRGPIKRGDLDSVLNEYSQSQKYNPYTDLILAVKACISVCEKAYAMKEAPDNVQTNSAFTA